MARLPWTTVNIIIFFISQFNLITYLGFLFLVFVCFTVTRWWKKTRSSSTSLLKKKKHQLKRIQRFVMRHKCARTTHRFTCTWYTVGITAVCTQDIPRVSPRTSGRIRGCVNINHIISCARSAAKTNPSAFCFSSDRVCTYVYIYIYIYVLAHVVCLEQNDI